MDILKICGFTIIVLVAISIVKQIKQELCFSVRAMAAISFVGIIISLSIPIYSFVEELYTELPSSFGYCEIIIKGLGIALVVRLCSDLCRDMGEPSIGGYVEAIGKIQLIVLMLPTVKEIIGSVKELVL